MKKTVVIAILFILILTLTSITSIVEATGFNNNFTQAMIATFNQLTEKTDEHFKKVIGKFNKIGNRWLDSDGIKKEKKQMSSGEIVPVKVPVLMYHHISKKVNEGENIEVTPEKFREDMEILKEKKFTTIGLNDLKLYLQNDKNLPEKPIIITFDDGYTSNYKYAYPVAKDLDMKFVISIIGWSIGRDTFIDSNKKITPHFTEKEMIKMTNSGYIEIQNHTYDLHSPEGLSYGNEKKVGKGVMPMENEDIETYRLRLKKDLEKLDSFLKKNNIDANFITYPYGLYTQETEKIIKEIGFSGSVTTKEGIREYKSLEDLYEIPRININQTTEIEKILKTLN